MWFQRFPLFAAALAYFIAHSATAAQLDVIKVPGETLKGNPLGDPAGRRLAVFTPDNAPAEQPLPCVVYLPGWGGSSEDAIARGKGAWFGIVVDRLSAEGAGVRIAVVDGRSRYGGSQFLNSSATGRYADYVADEIVGVLKRRYAAPAGGTAAWIIAGHSSGAYGALMLAMARQSQFPAVVALSPDSDFEVTHKPLVEQEFVRTVTPAELEEAMAPRRRSNPNGGLAGLVMGLCANYAPDRAHPGRFEWLYDASGRWRPEVWQRWLDLDPLTAVRRDANAFGATQRVYLDGAEHDEFGANIGARKIQAALSGAGKAAVTFYESPNGHSDHLPERLERGLRWVFGKPVTEIGRK